MKAVEFTSEVSDRGQLQVPLEVARRLPQTGKVRVIVLFPSDDAHDADWARLTAEQFLAGYAPGDAMYDEE